ncbi:hypothetical protein Barb4_04285 [Bacteroidales bacterium Barb4]|nr:hypothetical protein Barb4_04285 [Bacteroidales bacterium Barb4]
MTQSSQLAELTKRDTPATPTLLNRYDELRLGAFLIVPCGDLSRTSLTLVLIIQRLSRRSWQKDKSFIVFTSPTT